MKIKITLVFLFVVSISFSQNGLKFAELAKRLDPYFDRSLISDIQRQLPQGSDYTIWGYDVGDFSGDGYNDVALSIRVAADRKKELQVFMFVDIDGFLTKVGHKYFNFVDIPLEIGVVIRDNICYATKKNEQYSWLMLGYSFKNGVLYQVDEFSTSRIGDLTLETYTNYSDLRSNYKLLNTKTGEQNFYRDYLTVPSYPRGTIIYEGYASDVKTHYIDYVSEGAYYWSGTEDAHFTVSSAYDNDFLYLTLAAYDESVVKKNCDTCLSDYFEVWLDAGVPQYRNGKFNKINDKTIEFRTKADSNIFCFTVYPGNFLDIPSNVKISTTDMLSAARKIEANNIRSASNLTEEGFIVKFKIPFSLLGFQGNPVKYNDFYELGMTVVYHDYDNEFRPEEKSVITTSLFNSTDPSSYGSLLIVPENYKYGTSTNIYTDDILKSLLEYGF